MLQKFDNVEDKLLSHIKKQKLNTSKLKFTRIPSLIQCTKIEILVYKNKKRRIFLKGNFFLQSDDKLKSYLRDGSSCI